MGLETDAYVVISHPAPVNPPQPTMTVTLSGSNVVIAWDEDAGLFKLESSSGVAAPPFPWPAVSPQPPIVGPANGHYSMTVAVSSGVNQFFRLSR